MCFSLFIVLQMPVQQFYQHWLSLMTIPFFVIVFVKLILAMHILFHLPILSSLLTHGSHTPI